MPREMLPYSASIADGFELFDEYERVKRYDMHSHILMAHLATHHLSPDGYILFNSELASYNRDLVPKTQSKPSVLNFVKNATIAK